MKSVKRLLVQKGFHHSWGVWVSNSNKANRIIINGRQLFLTKRSCFFDEKDRIIVPRSTPPNLKEIGEKIDRYFS